MTRMLLHQELADCANWVRDRVDAEIERNGEEKSARHHHQTMLGMWDEVNIGIGLNQGRYTHANLADGDL